MARLRRTARHTGAGLLIAAALGAGCARVGPSLPRAALAERVLAPPAEAEALPPLRELPAVPADVNPASARDVVAIEGHATRALALADAVALARLQAGVPHQIAVARKMLAEAQAEQARADAALKLTSEDVDKAILEARAGLEAAQAAHVLAEARLARALAGEKKIDVVRHAAQAAGHASEKASAAVQVAQARELQIHEAERLVDVKKSLVEETRRAPAVGETNLRYTRIVARFPGVIVHRYRHLGDTVAVGTPVLSMYNPELTYVTAHLEETKLESVAPGNDVRLDIDAFDAPFRGRVVWINRATGANFALVPRNLSSGEFTRVVQRVPVRILIEKDEHWPQLRAGLSETVSIAHGPGDPEWAAEAAQAMRELESQIRQARD